MERSVPRPVTSRTRLKTPRAAARAARWLVALVAILGPACLVQAESLGEIAAREREKQRATPHAAKTYTNEDLQEYQSTGRELTTWVRNLHYPSETDPEKIQREAEADLTSMHYRRAIQKVHPEGVLPDKVDRVEATARRGEDVTGFGSGVVVDALVFFYLRDNGKGVNEDQGVRGTTSLAPARQAPGRSVGTSDEATRERPPAARVDVASPPDSTHLTYNMPCGKAHLPTCAKCLYFQMELHSFAKDTGRWTCTEKGFRTLVSFRNVSCTEAPNGPNPVYEATCAP